MISRGSPGHLLILIPWSLTFENCGRRDDLLEGWGAFPLVLDTPQANGRWFRGSKGFDLGSLPRGAAAGPCRSAGASAGRS